MSFFNPAKKYAILLKRLISSRAFPKIRFLIILLIAISMAEFVALDVGIILAADILFYVEAVLGTWALAFSSRLLPSLAAFSVMIMLKIDSFSKIYLKK